MRWVWSGDGRLSDHADAGDGVQNPDDPALESKVAPGMPLQVLCYERADDIAAGVSGVVTRARAIRASFPALNPAEIPMVVPVKQERVLYLLDPMGASRRSALLRVGDAFLRALRAARGWSRTTRLSCRGRRRFLNKHGGLVMSIGQFNQWVGVAVDGERDWRRFGRERR